MAKNIEEHLKRAEESFSKSEEHLKEGYKLGKYFNTYSPAEMEMAQYHMSVALYQQNLALIEVLKEKKQGRRK